MYCTLFVFNTEFLLRGGCLSLQELHSGVTVDYLLIKVKVNNIKYNSTGLFFYYVTHKRIRTVAEITNDLTFMRLPAVGVCLADKPCPTFQRTRVPMTNVARMLGEVV